MAADRTPFTVPTWLPAGTFRFALTAWYAAVTGEILKFSSIVVLEDEDGTHAFEVRGAFRRVSRDVFPSIID